MLNHPNIKGLVHRDLKPSNILVAKSGAKLLDLALADVTPVILR
jgi:serine/threonine protein kinase